MMFWKKFLAGTLSATLCLSAAAPVLAAPAEGKNPLDNAVQHYISDDYDFLKISHPDKPVSTEEAPQADGIVDYMGIVDPADPRKTAAVAIPGSVEGANGQGDRGQNYSWASASYGDWAYVSTNYASMMATLGLMDTGLGHSYSPETMNALIDALYRGTFFRGQEDGGNPASVLCKINVKTGESKLLMSKATTGTNVNFRNALEYNGKLYFCGAVNGVPSIYEVDPTTDSYKCVYMDKTMARPDAWPEAMKKKLSPTIRGITTFGDYLAISCVGLDANPYIAISKDPAKGFTPIAYAWDDVEKGIPGELLGYPACHFQDSIYGGSIWEMIEYNGRLYVAICTGTPENSPDGGKTFQSFALIRGECTGDPESPDAWTWTPIAGDKEKDGAKYTFGIDPQRTRSGACNMVVYDDHLYVGEYNDMEIGMINVIFDMDFQFMADNLEQAVSLYRMDKNEDFELVMGNSTEMFPKSLSGMKSGFGAYENQYIWQSQVFQDKLYLGTFDQTSLTYPIAQISNGDMLKLTPQQWEKQLRYLKDLIDILQKDKDEEEKKPASRSALHADAARLLPGLRLADFRVLGEIVSAQDQMKSLLNENGSLNALTMPRLFGADGVRSLSDLHLGLLVLPQIMETREDWSIEEKLEAKDRFCQLYEELYQYFKENCQKLPEFIRGIYEELLSDERFAKVHNMGRCLYYLKDAERGFDLAVTDDGIHFDLITRDGLGDPYNHGLRAFAVNETAEQPWMTIGTANPFYGTQVWRLLGETGEKPETPEQPEKPRPVFPGFGGYDSKVEITFAPGNGYVLEGTGGLTVDKDGSVRVHLTGSCLNKKDVPDAKTDPHCKIVGWAVLNEKGQLVEIDLDTHRFTEDTVVYPLLKDLWVPYKDVKPTDWYYQACRDLSLDGVISGYADGTYNGEGRVTWGAALKLVLLAAGYPEQTPVIGSTHACSGYLDLAKAEGVVEAEASIDLYQPISRVDFARIVAKALKLDEPQGRNPFTDVNDALVTALQKAGILEGYGDGRFGPQDQIKRSHIAAIIWRVNQYRK